MKIRLGRLKENRERRPTEVILQVNVGLTRRDQAPCPRIFAPGKARDRLIMSRLDAWILSTEVLNSLFLQPLERMEVSVCRGSVIHLAGGSRLLFSAVYGWYQRYATPQRLLWNPNRPHVGGAIKKRYCLIGVSF